MARILIIDDSRLGRAKTGDALRTAGHAVEEASDGAVALERIARESFDGIVSDLLMPNCDGFEMLRQLRAAGHDMPVIICSADIQNSSRRMCEQLGIAGFLHKPIQAAELIACVEACLPAHTR